MTEESMTWMNHLKDDPRPFLLNAEPWTRYRTLTDLLGKEESDPEVTEARSALLRHPLVAELIGNLEAWFEKSITRHNDPKLPQHRLKLLADLGVQATDPGIPELIKKIESHKIDTLYGVRQTLPEKKFKIPDTHADEWHALPCDTPEISASLMAMGYASDSIHESYDAITSLWSAREPWFCHFFFVEGQFKKTAMPCPMAALMALDLFSMTRAEGAASTGGDKPDMDTGLAKAIETAFKSLEYHRASGRSLYYFGRSKKFWTLKFPFV